MTVGRPREFDYDKALEQATRVFWKKGFEGTSMPDLTEAMGMNRPSIYAAFGNKEELFRKALDHYAVRASAKFEELLNAPTLREALERCLLGTAESLADKNNPRGCLAIQGALVGSEDSKHACKEAQLHRETNIVLIEARIERAISEGELPRTTNAGELARFYGTVMQGMAIQSVSGATCADMRAIAQHALAALPVK